MAGALINSPAITGPGDSLQQFEDPIELMQAKRKQEIALALLKQLQGGPPQPQQTRILAKTPLMSTLLHAGSQGMAANRLAEADAQIGEITKQQQQAYSQGASELMGSQDQRAAIAKALSSSNPQLRALAAAQEKARREAEEKDRERQNSRANALLPVLGQNGMVTEAGNIAASGQVPQGLTRPPVVAPRVEYVQDPNDPKKRIPHQIDTKLTGEQSGTLLAPGTNVTTTVGNERALDKGISETVIENFKKNLAGAEGAHALNNQLSRLESLSQDGVITGPATKPLEWISGLAGAAGLPVDRARLANTQEFNSITEQAVQAMIAGMAGGNRGITGEESKRIMGMLPMAANSPEARAQITAELRQINQRRIDGFKEQARAIGEARKTGNFDNLEELVLPQSLGTSPVPAPAGKPKPAAAPATGLPGGQTPEVMAERIKIVKAEFDRETDPATKAALGRELQRLQQGMGGANPAPASPDRFKGFSIVR